MATQPTRDEELPPHQQDVAGSQRKWREKTRVCENTCCGRDGEGRKDAAADFRERYEPARYWTVGTPAGVVLAVLEFVEEAQQKKEAERRNGAGEQNRPRHQSRTSAAGPRPR